MYLKERIKCQVFASAEELLEETELCISNIDELLSIETIRDLEFEPAIIMKESLEAIEKSCLRAEDEVNVISKMKRCATQLAKSGLHK